MNEVLATGIFTLVGVIIGAIINGLISFYSEKRQKKEQLSIPALIGSSSIIRK